VWLNKVSNLYTIMSPTERCSEKSARNFVGRRTDKEDALQRLDKLTHHEARLEWPLRKF
jgi:hypothetical protein